MTAEDQQQVIDLMMTKVMDRIEWILEFMKNKEEAGKAWTDRYVGTEAEENDGMPFEEKMKHLTAQLKEQFEEGDKLEMQIKNNLKSIGYGWDWEKLL